MFAIDAAAFFASGNFSHRLFFSRRDKWDWVKLFAHRSKRYVPSAYIVAPRLPAEVDESTASLYGRMTEPQIHRMAQQHCADASP